MARITIDEQGKVEPPGAAYVETKLPRSTKHVKAVPQTGSNGRFVVALVPGDYHLDPQSPDPSRPYPIGKPQTVTVQADEWTRVTVSYDTGIR